MKRLREVDNLYAIGIILVLAGHSHSSNWTRFTGTFLETLIAFIYTFHMPLFFYIAGFLFCGSRSLEREGCVRWIRNKAIRLLVPYVFWTYLALFPKYYLENGSLEGIDVRYLIRIMLWPRDNIWGHFWFLPVMFLAYLLAVLLWKVKDPYPLAGALIFRLIPVNVQLFGLHDLSQVLVFFFLGKAVRKWLPADNPAVFLTANQTDNRYISLLKSVGMVFVCHLAARRIPRTRAAVWLSSHNYTLFLFSWFFQATVMLFLDRWNVSWIPTFFAMFGAGLLGPLVLIRLYDLCTPLHRKPIMILLGIRLPREG